RDPGVLPLGVREVGGGRRADLVRAVDRAVRARCPALRAPALAGRRRRARGTRALRPGADRPRRGVGGVLRGRGARGLTPWTRSTRPRTANASPAGAAPHRVAPASGSRAAPPTSPS